MQETQNLVIGFGKAGKTLAAALAKRGEAVTLIERSPDMFGGTCINVACIPTKALIHGAETGTPYPPAWAAKNTVVETLREKNRAALLSNEHASLIVGEARFIDAHTVAVRLPSGEEQRLRAARIFINTGTVPAVPPIEGVRESQHCYTSTTLMQRPERPDSLVVVGGGFIGVEFASMMAQFGTQVTLLEGAPTFLPREDEDVATALREQLERRGVRIVTGAQVSRVRDVQDDTAGAVAEVGYTADGQAHTLRAQAVLLATGRTPTTAALDLTAAGIDTDASGFIQVNDQVQTSQPHIWALGDINGGPQFTFISLDDQRIVLNQLTGGAYTSRAERPQWATCVFTTPPLAHIGLREREARERGIDFRVAKLPAAAVPKARILGQTDGFLKALVDTQSGKIIGCTLLCPEAHEVINTVQIAVNAGLPASTLRTAIYTHPSMTEALNDLFAGV